MGNGRESRRHPKPRSPSTPPRRRSVPSGTYCPSPSRASRTGSATASAGPNLFPASRPSRVTPKSHLSGGPQRGVRRFPPQARGLDDDPRRRDPPVPERGRVREGRRPPPPRSLRVRRRRHASAHLRTLHRGRGGQGCPRRRGPAAGPHALRSGRFADPARLAAEAQAVFDGPVEVSRALDAFDF
jgi:hypothetical protein